ncbi:unnamed protein product, partial [Symbiodinium pilosum]
MVVKRTLGKLLLALVWLPPQAALAGWRGHEKPMPEHRGLDIARWPVLSKDFLVNLCASVGTVVAAILAFVALRFTRRDSERAQRESKEGRVQAVVDCMMQPFSPETKQEKVVGRGIIEDIRRRIQEWDQHATIIAGRFGSGKSVALAEALRGMQGVYVHTVEGKDWKE